VSKWTDDKLATLRRMWEQEYTASEIGEEIGMSRNAVLGKAHRENLSARVNPVMTKTQIFERVLDRIIDENMTLAEAADAEAMPRMTALKMWNAVKAARGEQAV
jgi:hypothetical protein